MADSNRKTSKPGDREAPRNTDPASPEKPVKPRDAASLVLYRSVAGSTEVLLGRRPSKSRFMPDVYVYPGGAVDPTDARAKPATNLNPKFTSRLAVSNSDARARAMGMAAVRETFEETGLLVTADADPGNIQSETWGRLRALSQAPDLQRLSYLGRAITPPIRPIRFHARFFACDAGDIGGSLEGNGELIDLKWVSVKDTADLDMRIVTRYMLDRLVEMLESGDPHWVGDTMFTQRNKKPYIKKELPGE